MTSSTVSLNEDQDKSSPKNVNPNDQALDTSAINRLNSPAPNPPKSQPTPKTAPSLLSLPIDLSQISPSCDEDKKATYETEYQRNLEAENTYHESEVFRISGLGLLDELLQKALNNEEARHQSVLTELQMGLNDSLDLIACS